MKAFHTKYIVGSFFVLGLVAISIALPLASEHVGHDTNHSDSSNITLGDPYYLSTCPVSGQKLGSMGKPVAYIHEGREVRFCCSGCIKQFKKEPKKYIDKIDQQMIKDQLPHYPLKTCMVSGKKIEDEEKSSNHKPVNFIFKNRLIRFCCASCVSQFEKDTKKYINQLNKAVIKQQKDGYPLEKCIASGQKLGGSMGEPVDSVLANRLVRLCCPSCQKMLHAHPNDYLSKLDKHHDKQPSRQQHHDDHSNHHQH